LLWRQSIKFVGWIKQKNQRAFVKFGSAVGRDTRRGSLDFRGDGNSFVDS